jgi:phosphoenolpyruvate-protein phosphotransferase (PTS system enzyme I)
MKELKGISASPGIAVGRAFLFSGDDEPAIPRYLINSAQVAGEWGRLETAVAFASAEVTKLRDRTATEMGEEQSKIFDAHIMMLNDPDLLDQIAARLKADLVNVEWIVHEVTRELVEKLGESKDEYLSERALDIRDVAKRLLNALLLRERRSLSGMEPGSILVAHDLLPSDAISLDRTKVVGIAMDVGGKTSHTAILARSFGIPAVLGLGEITRLAHDGEVIIADGFHGAVVIDPDPATAERYADTGKRLAGLQAELREASSLPSETTDGVSVVLNANIESPEEVESVLGYGAAGIGLYRSEFLFLKPGSLASEEMQFEAYRRVLVAMGDRPVTIRTLDVGGDKLIPDVTGGAEKNPLLGWRAIRFCLSRTEVFKTQLRALMRASAFGNLKIMFPMIACVEELDDALAILAEVKAELSATGISYRDDVPVGIMIEVPSAAMSADILARKSAFFSIGTNDLIQYTLAVDRGNEKTAYLYQPFHPGILRLVKLTIEGAHASGIPVAMCGELAGEPYATVVLLGLGLDEFSMTSSSLPVIRRVVRGVSMDDAKGFARLVLNMESYREIEPFVKHWMDEHFDIARFED